MSKKMLCVCGKGRAECDRTRPLAVVLRTREFVRADGEGHKTFVLERTPEGFVKAHGLDAPFSVYIEMGSAKRPDRYEEADFMHEKTAQAYFDYLILDEEEMREANRIGEEEDRKAREARQAAKQVKPIKVRNAFTTEVKTK